MIYQFCAGYIHYKSKVNAVNDQTAKIPQPQISIYNLLVNFIFKVLKVNIPHCLKLILSHCLINQYDCRIVISILVKFDFFFVL